MQTLAGLDTFVVLANAGSVQGAARTLGVPRSTVSRRLNHLEQELGLPLLDRTPRGFRLTHAGRLLWGRGRELVRELRALKEDVQQLQGAVRGPLRVSAPPGLGTEFLIEFLRHLRDAAPGLEPDLVVRDGVPDLLEEDLDVAFVDGDIHDSPWIMNQIGEATRICVASIDYLKTHGRPESPRELSEHVCLGLRSDLDRAGEWPLRAGGGVAVQPQMQANDLQLIRLAVLNGFGIALLPLYAVGMDLFRGDLVHLLPEIGREARLVALTARRRSASRRLQIFFAVLEDFTTRYATELPS